MHSILSYLEEPEFHVLHNLYVRRDGRSSQIDHLVIGSNGIWVIESKYRKDKIIVDRGRWIVVTESGRTILMVSPVAQNYRHIIDVREFLRSHIGDRVDEIPFHNVACLSDGVELKVEDPTEGDQILTPDELLRCIRETSSPNPMSPSLCTELADHLRTTAARPHLERVGRMGAPPLDEQDSHL